MEIPNNRPMISTDITEAIRSYNGSPTISAATPATPAIPAATIPAATNIDGYNNAGTIPITNNTDTQLPQPMNVPSNQPISSNSSNAGKYDIAKEKNQNDITSFNKRYMGQYGNMNTMELSEFDTTDPFGASVTNYRQGILNAIARWNSKSAATNYAKRLFNSNRITAEDMKKTREKRIREALNQVLSVENLGEYQAGSAFFDATLNMVTSKKIKNNATQGGKYRKYKKNYTRRHKKNYTRHNKK